MKFPFLFSPITINKMELKNRIVMAAMHLGYNEEGGANDRLIRFYTRRAEGGVGLIIVGQCGVDRETTTPGLALYDDCYIPGLRNLCESVQRHGARIAAQSKPHGG